METGKKYEEPIMKLIRLEENEVIVTSPDSGEGPEIDTSEVPMSMITGV